MKRLSKSVLRVNEWMILPMSGTDSSWGAVGCNSRVCILTPRWIPVLWKWNEKSFHSCPGSWLSVSCPRCWTDAAVWSSMMVKEQFLLLSFCLPWKLLSGCSSTKPATSPHLHSAWCWLITKTIIWAQLSPSAPLQCWPTLHKPCSGPNSVPRTGFSAKDNGNPTGISAKNYLTE